MRTVGVEEEFLIFSGDGGGLAGLGEAVVDEASEQAPDGELIEHELKRAQAETGTVPTTSMTELGDELARLRGEVITAAARRGALVAALGTSPHPGGSATVDDPRYERMLAAFGAVAAEQLTCGQHVHVAIESRAEGVAVIDRLQPWLPVLRAIAANSPFWHGDDTGYASFRSLRWGLWPSAGPTPGFADEAGYDRAVAELIASGAALDEGMIYFDARLSASYPTVEIRVADVCSDRRDAVLVAALSRGLVSTAAARWQSDTPTPELGLTALRAAHWTAARYGLADSLFGPSGRQPAADALAELVDFIRPALRASGDEEAVELDIKRLLEQGTGAERQRASLRRGGDLVAVVRDAVAQTAAR